MALTKERQGEIAMYILQRKLENNGNLKLMPSEIKREIANSSKKSKIPQNELAEFYKIVFEEGYLRIVAELDKILTGKVE